MSADPFIGDLDLDDGESIDWGEPDVPSSPAPADLPVAAMPEVIRDYVTTVGEAMQVPVEMVLPAVIATLSATQLGKARVRATVDFSEPLNMEVLGIAPPGARKSSVFEIVTRPLVEWERERVERVGTRRAEAIALLDARRKQCEAVLRDYTRGQETEAELENARRGVTEAERAVPLLPRIFVQDATPEALGVFMRDTGGIAAVFSPEGDAISSFTRRYSDGGGLQAELLKKGWSGESVRNDRVNRDSIIIHEAHIAACVFTQPGVLQRMNDTEAMREQGVWGRFLIVRAGKVFGDRVSPLRAPRLDRGAVARYEGVVRRMLGLHQWDSSDSSNFGCREVKLGAEALEVTDRWWRELEPRLAPGGRWAGMTDWAGKVGSHVLRTAALLHIADHVDRGRDPFREELGEGWTETAFQLVDAISTHVQAELVGTTTTDFDANLLTIFHEVLERGDDYSVSEYHEEVKGRTWLRRVGDLEPYISELEARDCIRIASVSSGVGRPPKRWRINPRIRDSKNPKNTENSGAAG